MDANYHGLPSSISRLLLCEGGFVAYIMVEVGNPMHAACHIWVRDRWLMPNMGHSDLIEVEKEMPDAVKYIGNVADIEHPVIPKTSTRYMSLVWELTEAAYVACVKRWEARSKSK